MANEIPLEAVTAFHGAWEAARLAIGNRNAPTGTKTLAGLNAALPHLLADQPMKVESGLYRNSVGAELNVMWRAMNPGPFYTLDADIWLAWSVEKHGPVKNYLVTAHSLNECGYVIVGGDSDE